MLLLEIDMEVLKRGLITNVTEESQDFDGEKPMGFSIEVVDDTSGSTGGYYILYKHPNDKARGYDSWHESYDGVDAELATHAEQGTEIQWEE